MTSSQPEKLHRGANETNSGKQAQNLNAIMRNRKLHWALFLIVLAYYAIGAFPISPVEGDGVSMACGSEQLAKYGTDAPDLTYSWNVQPGLQIVGAVLHWVTRIDTYVLMSLFCLVCGLLFVTFSGALSGRVTGVSPGLCALAILVLLPESIIAAYYPNSRAGAGAFGMAGLVLLAGEYRLRRLVIAGVLIGIASLFRFDFAVMGIACIPILHRGKWRQTAARVLSLGAIAGIVALGGIYGCGSSIFAILNRAGGHYQTGTAALITGLSVRDLASNSFLLSHVSFFPVVTVLLVLAGAIYLVAHRRWRVLAVVVLGVLPIYLLYFRALTTSKYLYYTIPFLAMSLVFSVRWALDKKSPIRVGSLALVVVLFLAQFVLGVRLEVNFKPWITHSMSPLATLWQKSPASGPIDRIAVVIGAGFSTPRDGPRYSTGQLFSPAAWHCERRKLKRAFNALTDCFREGRGNSRTIYTTIWQSTSQVNRALQVSGYRCTEKLPDVRGNAVSIWRKGDEIFSHVTHGDFSSSWDRRVEGARLIEADRIIYVTGGGREATILEANAESFRTVFRLNDLSVHAVSIYTMPLDQLRVGRSRPAQSASSPVESSPSS